MNLRFLLLLCLLGLGPSNAATDPQTVLKAVVDNQRGGSLRATLILSITRPERQTQLVLEVASDGNERAITWVKAPPREAGQAFLRVGDNIQLYNPTLKRVLRLPPSGRSDSFLGSDLSYSDLAGRDLEQDFTPKVEAESESEITLELLPRPQAPTPYGKLVLRASKPGFAPREVIYYDQRGQAVRKITFAQWVQAGGRSFPTQVTVEDLLRPGHRTQVVYSNYRFGVPIPEGCFTVRALEAGC
ncbi:outer membrane lipoprotein-sorting protein [Meiothermus ruber]|uniref:Uncharacterized protein TP-0789 domain-containing protein n=1 Tax=Meiothermus ruber (strain ATCC 35948 / DSM 1279 / VKM B-1258 / 21) TaxID=504728 RepID=A0A806DMD3_MEIRD|nr:outer membrane lipoprotein-sorting protein [Meiothermus ruber]ADD29649.1 hypothetical protein Mrub_2902 [Meiothermus ruber DSM 1279]MCL6530601.1 outer membrane lipoprotein-sorting protein [Meiothermus ruber]GAO76563.1 putative uncharacterized protein [Meiothermus ruber H328]